MGKKAFTLVEILIVLAICSLCAAIAFPDTVVNPFYDRTNLIASMGIMLIVAEWMIAIFR